MTAWLSQLEWQQPLWLVLLLLPLAAAVVARYVTGSARRSCLAALISPALWRWLVVEERRFAGRAVSLTLLAAWSLACLAAAGPVFNAGERVERGLPAVNIVVVVDISPSMAVPDVAPDRLARARLQLLNFVDGLAAARLALVAFSANAYTVLPLTSDRSAFNHFLANLAPGLVSVAGSNLTRALALADQALSQPVGDQAPPGGLVLLISDGEIHDDGAMAAAARLVENGHRLHALGVGTDAGGPVPSLSGRLIRHEFDLVVSTRDGAALQALADAGGGAYADLGPGGWAMVADAIATLQRQRLQVDSGTSGIALFPWLLTAAVALMVWHAYRRPQALALWLVLPGMAIINDAYAAPWQEATGLKQLQQENYDGALETYGRLENYSGLIGFGVAAYKLGQWARAEDAFRRAAEQAGASRQQAKAAYNLGNALIQQGRLNDAADAYRRALVWQPGHANAMHNLALLEQHRHDSPALSPPPVQRSSPDRRDVPVNRPDGEYNQQGAESQGDAPGTLPTPASAPVLQSSLEHWRELSGGDAPPQRLLQQLDRLEEDTTTFLEYRFAKEDAETVGGGMEKPW